MLELNAETIQYLKYVFDYDSRRCYRCKICNCGPWFSLAPIEEHFKILGFDREEHLVRYRAFLEECSKMGVSQ